MLNSDLNFTTCLVFIFKHVLRNTKLDRNNTRPMRLDDLPQRWLFWIIKISSKQSQKTFVPDRRFIFLDSDSNFPRSHNHMGAGRSHQIRNWGHVGTDVLMQQTTGFGISLTLRGTGWVKYHPLVKPAWRSFSCCTNVSELIVWTEQESFLGVAVGADGAVAAGDGRRRPLLQRGLLGVLLVGRGEVVDGILDHVPGAHGLL